MPASRSFSIPLSCGSGALWSFPEVSKCFEPTPANRHRRNDTVVLGRSHLLADGGAGVWPLAASAQQGERVISATTSRMRDPRGNLFCPLKCCRELSCRCGTNRFLLIWVVTQGRPV
jgi:hypothetical protein